MMFEDIVGNSGIKTIIERAIVSAKTRQKSMGHLLIHGSGGLGKTFWMNEIARELGYMLFTTQGSRLTTPAKICSLLVDSTTTARTAGQTAFIIIDEIHEVPVDLQEELYYPMAEYRIVQNGSSVSIGPFTLCGATTRIDLLDSKSFMERFLYVCELRPLEVDELGLIIGYKLFTDGVLYRYGDETKLAERCFGNPRTGIRYASLLTDFVLHKGRYTVEDGDVESLFDSIGIDSLGLDGSHRKYLMLLMTADRPMSLGTIAGSLDVHPDTVLYSIEPRLLQLGLIIKESNGRKLSSAGMSHAMGKEQEK